jgi:DNA-binding MarR family transcriptional regulator
MTDSPAAFPLDAETKVLEAREDHKAEIRLWLRLLTLTNMIESEIRRGLRDRFDTTLPRFDLMAQLERAHDGMTMSELSKRMMVSNGNITGLVDRLVESGQIERRTAPNDRRSQMIRATPEGHADFSRMAREHETWLAGMFMGLSSAEIETLMRLLAKAKASVTKASGTRAIDTRAADKEEG